MGHWTPGLHVPPHFHPPPTPHGTTTEGGGKYLLPLNHHQHPILQRCINHNPPHRHITQTTTQAKTTHQTHHQTISHQPPTKRTRSNSATTNKDFQKWPSTSTSHHTHTATPPETQTTSHTKTTVTLTTTTTSSVQRDTCHHSPAAGWETNQVSHHIPHVHERRAIGLFSMNMGEEKSPAKTTIKNTIAKKL